MLSKIVIYTAITSGKDPLHEPAHVLPGVDYVCFTDTHLSSATFEIRPLPFSEKTPRLTARRCKLSPHHLFPEHEASLWLDGSKKIRRDLTPLLEALAPHAIASFAHPHRDCLYDEAALCIHTHRENIEALQAQTAHYREENMPASHGLYETSLLWRKHSPHNAELMQSWWHEVLTRSVRDQLSLPYILWKNGETIHTLDYRQWHDPYFLQFPHRWNPPGDSRNSLSARLHDLWWRSLQRAGLQNQYERSLRRIKKILS